MDVRLVWHNGQELAVDQVSTVSNVLARSTIGAMVLVLPGQGQTAQCWQTSMAFVCCAHGRRSSKSLEVVMQVVHLTGPSVSETFP
mmetsp:Transcript_29282/g.77397  ORF Transcript_29282/g.77397 Transcript_29282/m.77397 type:complete len:86 (-) Transcript_29282:582-839(-)